MANLTLLADTGFYDPVTDSRANLNNLQAFIHGSGASSSYNPSGYFLCHCTDKLVLTDYNISLSLYGLSNKNFDVTLIITPNISEMQIMTFTIYLNPDDGTETPLPSIPITGKNTEVKFHVENKSNNGVYYIIVYSVFSSTSNFTLEKIIVTECA